MNYNCHKLGGFTAASIAGMYTYQKGLLDHYSFNINQYIELPVHPHPYIIPLIILFMISLFASTLPDIDHPLSVPGRKVMGFSEFLNRNFGHRGITHYPLTLCFVGFIMYFVWKYISMPEWLHVLMMWCVIGFVVGYLSHILLDTFNSAGVALLAPFSKVKVKIPTGIRIVKRKGKWKVCWRYLRGGNSFDNFIVFFCLFFLVYLCAKIYLKI